MKGVVGSDSVSHDTLLGIFSFLAKEVETTTLSSFAFCRTEALFEEGL